MPRARAASRSQKEDSHFAGVCRGLQNDGAKPAQRPDELGGEGAHGFNPLHLRVERGGGFELEIGRCLVALCAEGDKTAFASRGQKVLHGCGFFLRSARRCSL